MPACQVVAQVRLRCGRSLRVYKVRWHGHFGGSPLGSISIVTQAHGVRLLYWVTGPKGERSSVNEFVPFAYTPTRFSGRRQWLMCLKCGRRCRQCHGLTYALRNETSAAMHRADRIANRLHDMWKSATKPRWQFPPKLSRMRWKTYWRLKHQYDSGPRGGGSYGTVWRVMTSVSAQEPHA